MFLFPLSLFCYSSEGGKPVFVVRFFPINFCGFLSLDSRFCGNDDGKFAVVSDNTEAFRLHSYHFQILL